MNRHRTPTPSRPRYRGKGDSRRPDLPLRDERGININFLWRDAGVALQIDYDDFTPKERLLNSVNDETLRASGLTVLRVPEAQLRERPDEVIEDIRRAFEERGADWRADGLGV
jgi:hypothetical protein